MCIDRNYIIEETIKGYSYQFDLEASYQDLLENIPYKNNDTYIGSYEKLFLGNNHVNYCTKVDFLGMVLISAKITADSHFILVRSILGFKVFKYSKSHLMCIPNQDLYPVKLSLDQYFSSVFGVAWEVDKDCVVEECESRFGFLNFLYQNTPDKQKTISSENIVTDDFSDTATISTTSTIHSGLKNPEKMKSVILNNRTTFKTLEIFKNLKVVDRKYDTEILKLDEFGSEYGYIVDVLIDSEIDNQFIKKYFGSEVQKSVIVKNDDTLPKLLDFDVEDLKIIPKDSPDQKEYLINEFIATEANYLLKLNEFFTEYVWSDNNELIKYDLGGMYEIYIFTRKFVSELIRCMKDFSYKSPIPEDLLSPILIENISISYPDSTNFLEILVTLIIFIFDEVSCYNKFCRDGDSKLKPFLNEKKKNAENNINEEDIRNISSIFNLPIQRLCRYQLFFKNILRYLPQESETISKFKIFYLQFSKFIRNINDSRAAMDSLKSTLILSNMIDDLPHSLITNNRRYIYHLDCISPIKENNLTLILFTGILMIVRRKTEPFREFTVQKIKQYSYLKHIAIDNIKIKSIRNTRFILNTVEDESMAYRKLNDAYTQNEDGRINESTTLFANSIQFKHQFFRSFRLEKNNINFTNSKGKLYLREDQNIVFFHVYDKDEYVCTTKKKDAVIICTNDLSPLKDWQFNDILVGRLSENSLFFKSSNNFEIRNMYHKDLSYDSCFINVLVNAIELHRRIPEQTLYLFNLFSSNSVFLYESHEISLATSNFKYLGKKIDHFIPLHPDKITMIFNFIVAKLICFSENGLLVSKNDVVAKREPKTSSISSFIFNSNVSVGFNYFISGNEISSDVYQSLIYFESLYKIDDLMVIKDLYIEILRAKTIDEKYLEKSGVHLLSAVVLFWVKHNIYYLASEESIDEIKELISTGKPFTPEKIKGMIFSSGWKLFVKFIKHVIDICCLAPSEVIFRILSIFISDMSVNHENIITFLSIINDFDCK